MTPIPLPLLDGDTFICDNSTLEMHQTCPRAAQYGISHRRRTVDQRTALRFGGIAHKCLEIRYKADLPSLEQTTEIEKSMIVAAEREYKGVQDPALTSPGDPVYVKGREPFIVPDDDFRTLDRMVDLVTKYGEAYRYEPFDLVRFPNGQPFVEIPFSIPIGTLDVNADFWVQDLYQGPDGGVYKRGVPTLRRVTTLKIVWQGKIDLAYTHAGGLYILDHKTSSIATNMGEFEISNQFYGYVWATEKMLRREVAGFVINRMICRKPTRTGIPFTFERKPIPVVRNLVNDWEKETVYMIADYVEMVRRQLMPKHTVWCVAKFGTCQFHKVCCNGDQQQMDFLLLESGEYEDNTWSPLKETD